MTVDIELAGQIAARPETLGFINKPLKTLNDRLVSYLPLSRKPLGELTVASIRGDELVLPQQLTRSLKRKGFSPKTVESLALNTKKIVDGSVEDNLEYVDGDCLVGHKILDRDLLYGTLNARFRGLQFEKEYQDNNEQKEAFEYWLHNFPHLAKDQWTPLWALGCATKNISRVLESVGVNSLIREMWLTPKISSILLGEGLVGLGKKISSKKIENEESSKLSVETENKTYPRSSLLLSRVGRGTGWFLEHTGRAIAGAPIYWQALQDIPTIDSGDQNNVKVEDVVGRYSLSMDNPIIRHHNALRSLQHAASLFSAGEYVDSFLGHGVYLALWGTFLLPGVNEFANNHHQEIVQGAIGTTLGFAGVRTLINAFSLYNKRTEYSPDLVGTAAYVFSSCKLTELVQGKMKWADRISEKEEGDLANHLARATNALGSSALGTAAYLWFQIATNTLPFTFISNESALGAWCANVFDEIYWGSISGYVAAKGKLNGNGCH